MTSPGTPPANPPDLPDISLDELLFWILRRRRRFRVAGASMHPLLKPGEEVLVNPRAYRQRPPRVGDIVIARHPFQPDLHIIKRVAGVLPNDMYRLVGDNRWESTDSRKFGPVPRDHILGQVTCRFA